MSPVRSGSCNLFSFYISFYFVNNSFNFQATHQHDYIRARTIGTYIEVNSPAYNKAGKKTIKVKNRNSRDIYEKTTGFGAKGTSLSTFLKKVTKNTPSGPKCDSMNPSTTTGVRI